MAFIPVSNTIEVEVRMFLDSQRIENTLYFRKIGGWDASAMEAMGAALITWWDDSFSTLLSNALSLNELYITDLTSNDATAVTVTPEEIITGKSGGSPVPNNAALCISFRTNQRGRSFRGRNYVPAIPEADVSISRVSGTVYEPLRDAYLLLIDLATSQDALWVVVSRFANNAPRTNGVPTTITNVVVTDNVIDSQRRRLPSRGT
jgi:hypothetical protein